MWIKKTKTVTKEVTEVIESYQICDKCDQKVDANKKRFDAYDMDFEIKFGEMYPNLEGEGEEFKLELCQKCAKILLKLLHTNGYKVQINEWSTY